MRPGRSIGDLSDLEAEARAFVSALRPRGGGATLVTLSGDLGSGKTAFTQAAARALGIKESVTSPTFVLAKSYDLPRAAFSKLVHIDAYRLKEGKDLRALNFEDLMEDPETLVMLEWPEMVEDGLPKSDVAIRLEALPDTTRAINYA